MTPSKREIELLHGALLFALLLAVLLTVGATRVAWILLHLFQNLR